MDAGSDSGGRSFRGLRVWQEAIALAQAVVEVADSLPSPYSFLADQLRRAARSVHANIAEGSGKASRRDFIRFLEISRGSLHEIESDFEFLRNTTLAARTAVEAVYGRIRNTGRLLNALIDSLRDSE